MRFKSFTQKLRVGVLDDEKYSEVVKDDLKKCGLDRGLAKQGEMEGSSCGENVQPVRARTRDVKQEEREQKAKNKRKTKD